MKISKVIVLGRSIGAADSNSNNKCNKVYFGDVRLNNIACLCNGSYRDELRFDWPRDDATFVRVQSNLAGLRFEQDELKLKPAGASHSTESVTFKPDFIVELEADKRMQQVTGFGGAFTDSASELITMLSEPAKFNLLEDYFGQSGLDYNMGRVPISGTDMSTRPYSYDDLPAGEEDLELKKFELQDEDLLYKIPLIRLVNSLKHSRKEDMLKLIAASWSAPAWMKSNLRLVQGRLIGNSSSGPYYMAYARYILKFLEEYERRHVKMWALTPQNEPHTPTRVGPQKINFNSNNFTPDEMADYLANCLIPTLLQANRTADALKLFIWDDTLDDMEAYERAALGHPTIRAYMAGTAIHWYSQGLRDKPYSLLHDVRAKVIPQDFSLISTEACYIGRPKPGSWDRGSGYARDIIENLSAGSVAWLDWNLALNMGGGPTWVGNYLDSAIAVDLPRQAYYKNPMYYALGHISRFVRPNSYVVPTTIYRKPAASDQPSAAWLTTSPNDDITGVAAELSRPLSWSDAPEAAPVLKRQMSLVLLNRASEPRKIKLALKNSGCPAKANFQPLELELSAKSITSLAFVC